MKDAVLEIYEALKTRPFDTVSVLEKVLKLAEQAESEYVPADIFEDPEIRRCALLGYLNLALETANNLEHA